jgi:trans-2,3-dihydro-3-hydroxyanthranilate isomerase
LRKIKVYHVDAFTDQLFGGNPAGVVPEAEGLNEDDMQKIAREINLSETAFLFPAADKEYDFRVRFFTPSSEIDFCGHATIGLAWIMAMDYGWLQKALQIRLKTNSGTVPVEWSMKGNRLDDVVMTQVAPKIKSINYDQKEICRIIGINPSDIDDKYPIRLAYTGNWHLIIPVKTNKAIDAAAPLFDELKDLNLKMNVSTTHLFTFDSFDERYNIYTRDFAPAVGILEDPVTGAANGALAGYLVLENILDSKMDHELTIAQGHSVGRPGELSIKIISGKNNPIIKVGGKAVISIEGAINY